MLGGTSESADALLNEFLFETQPLPVIQLDQAPLSVFDEDPQFALFAASNARNRRASLPSELLSGLDGLSFGGEYGMDPMDPLMMDPAMLELLGNGGAVDQGTVDPFDIYNTNPYNFNNSALSAGLSALGNNNNTISNAANHSAGSKPIPIPSNAHINSLKPPSSSSYSDRTLSTSAPQTGSDFFTLFAKSFKTPPIALSTSFANNNLVIPSPEASPIAGRRSSFSNPSGTSPMLNRRPSLSNPNASGPLGNRRGSLSNPSAGTQDAQHHMLHHPLQQQQQIESSILHKPRHMQQQQQQQQQQPFDPKWFYLLEEAECNQRAQHKIPFPFGTLFLSPQYPYWAAGNTLQIHTQEPKNLTATDAEILECIASVERHFVETCPSVKRSFTMTRDAEVGNKGDSIAAAVVSRWSALLAQQGYKDDSEDEDFSRCMGVTAQTLVTAVDPKGLDGRRVAQATMADFEAVLINEPGGDSNVGWRTVKCNELLSRAEKDSLTYLCYDAANEPVARVIVVFSDKVPGVGFVPRVNTRDEFRRKGYAKSVISYAFKDVFERGLATQIVLFASEDGPIKLYESVGMQILAEHVEMEFIKAASEFQ
ncbi:hypothetical protein HDU80_004541 [Chytriomyces hyalinus]|nr:hypothetical protein HDU80_004541 [Chytriomyces hyalinus]